MKPTRILVAVIASAVVALLLAPPAGAADLENGKKIYTESCARCHGAEGKGDGAMATYLDPKPANFTDKELMGQRTDAQLKEVILKGKAAMPAYEGTLGDSDVDDVVAQLRAFDGK
jgi:high-affinity iron transporter